MSVSQQPAGIRFINKAGNNAVRTALLLTAAIGGLSYGAGSCAQTAPADAGALPESSGLEEIIVTATKRTEAVNKVPISIVALPQQALVEQDLRSVQDISRATPGLFVTSSNNATGAQIAIRGVYSSIGAPTTAVYLDDIPLQKRLVNGTSSGSGSPFPQLYDLDRVEVLKGPQGTLYGESSEGGAVRFITPTPSLTTYSATARSELSDTNYGGDVNYENGVAFGGPIVQDKLGFRISLWDRHDSGYINHVFAYTGATLGAGTNSENRWLGRASVLFAPLDNLRFTLAYYISRDETGDVDTYTEYTPAFTVGAHGSVPAHTYGPFNYGPYKTILNCDVGQNYASGIYPGCYFPQSRIYALSIPSLSVDWEFEDFSIHSSTAYVMDDGRGIGDAGWADFAGLYGSAGIIPFNQPFYAGVLHYNNARATETEELRFTSAPNEGPWTWVGGVFASNQQTHQRSQDYSINFDSVVAALSGGRTVTQVYGAPTSPDGGISQRDQHVRETEYAAFGEVTYAVLDDLKGIVGLRVARDQIKYWGYLEGPFFGFAAPSYANGGLSGGDQFATAILPKFSVEYQLDEGQMIYATASKGERVGGVNTGPYYTKCATVFQSLGITSTPSTYQPDTLWNYELGAKMRMLDGKAQINGSLFYVDWSNVQVSYSLPVPCGFNYVANAGGALSKGGEIEAQAELLDGLITSFNATYTDAYYTSSVIGPGPTFAHFINQGNNLPVPPLSIDVSVKYNMPVLDQYRTYIRWDYQYNSAYKRGLGPGTSTYNPFTYNASQTQFVTMRLGATIDDFDVAFFIDNVFNSQDVLTRTGGGACTAASGQCATYAAFNPIFTDSTYRPRTIGLQVNYKFTGLHTEAEAPAPYVAPVVQAPAPAPTPSSYLVFFDFNKSDLTPQALSIVDTAAKNAGPAHVTQITCTGHTDTVGSDAYNTRLSRRRAESVAAELEKQGIPSSEIEIVAKGKHDLLVPTGDGVREPQNRRVQIVYSGGPTS